MLEPFGDIGTDLPLIVGMILAAKLDAATVLIMFGAMQIFTGLFYGMPMPAQPLKAVAVIVITQKLAPNVLYGGGLAIGMVMLLLSITGLIAWLWKVIPKKLSCAAFNSDLDCNWQHSRSKIIYPRNRRLVTCWRLLLPHSRWRFMAIAAIPRRYLSSASRFIYAFTYKHFDGMQNAVGLAWPKFRVPAWSDVWTGFLILALPQIAIVDWQLRARRRTRRQRFIPLIAHRHSPKYGLTYSFMNLPESVFRRRADLSCLGRNSRTLRFRRAHRHVVVIIYTAACI